MHLSASNIQIVWVSEYSQAYNTVFINMGKLITISTETLVFNQTSTGSTLVKCSLKGGVDYAEGLTV